MISFLGVAAFFGGFLVSSDDDVDEELEADFSAFTIIFLVELDLIFGVIDETSSTSEEDELDEDKAFGLTRDFLTGGCEFSSLEESELEEDDGLGTFLGTSFFSGFFMTFLGFFEILLSPSDELESELELLFGFGTVFVFLIAGFVGLTLLEGCSSSDSELEDDDGLATFLTIGFFFDFSSDEESLELSVGRDALFKFC